MILVIPVGVKRPPSLAYALRAHAEHVPVTSLVTVGEQPKGITPDLHIPSPNAAGAVVNVNRHLRRVCEEVSEPFVWSADDVFPMKPWTPCVHVRAYSIQKHYTDWVRLKTYAAAVKESIRVMKDWGYDPREVPCGAIHRPMLLEPERAQRCLDAISDNGHFKALYVAGFEDVVPIGDAKVKGAEQVKPSADCVSTDHNSWRQSAGKLVRESFAEPSPWETGMDADMALTPSGRAKAHRRHRNG